MFRYFAVVFVLVSCCCWDFTDCSFQTVPKIKYESDEIVLAKWNATEKGFQQLFGGMMKEMIGKLSDSEVELSEDCSIAFLNLLFGLRDLKLWSFELLDSIGKIPSGILRGNPTSLGNYDQCLAVRTTGVKNPFKGQYCLVDLKSPIPEKNGKIFINMKIPLLRNFTPETELVQALMDNAYGSYVVSQRFGICVPSTCTKDDVNLFVQNALKDQSMNGEVFMCEIEGKQNPIDRTILAILGVFGSIIGLVLLATMTDFGMEIYGKDLMQVKKNDMTLSERLISGFSMKINWIKLFRVTTSSDSSLGFLNGLRFFSMIWIIVGHANLFLPMQLWRDAILVNRRIEDLSFQIVLNGHMGVQTFLFITAVILSYNLVKSFDSMGPRVFNVASLLIHRLFRLIPMVMVSIGIMIVLPIIGNGPVWGDVLVPMADMCRKNWWQPLLSINNYVNYNETCMIHTWYVSLDVQLFLLALVYFALYFKKPIWGHGFSLVLIISSIISTGAVNYIYGFIPQLLPILLDLESVGKLISYTHQPIHVSICTYAISLSLGSFLARNKDIKLSKTVQFFGWISASATFLTVLFVIVIWDRSQLPTPLESLAYSSLHRTGWTLALSWMALACANGKGGYLNSFLSWSGYTVFNRISFIAYLIHIPVHVFFVASLRGTIEITNKMAVWLFGGTLIITYLCSFFLRLFFEAPLSELEGIILGGGVPTKKSKSKDLEMSLGGPQQDRSHGGETNNVIHGNDNNNGGVVLVSRTDENGVKIETNASYDKKPFD